MKNIEQAISPLVENQFPQFYKDEGANFVAFVKAYYEWLEDSTQYLTLDNATGFNVGDTLTQLLADSVPVTGTIISKDGNTIGVTHDTLEQFRCIDNCGVVHEVISSSGAVTYIRISTPGGMLYQARNLMKYRDIDSTIDRFILQFKEKYLKNIQFDTATNKKLLVKNSLDLYRSKGTERSVDLFFKLVYGTNAEVYYPGDDLFRLSDGEWVQPRYIEITATDRAIDYVGRQITGVTTGATAFVERYIKRRVKNSIIAILYISNIRGEFENGETLKTDRIYPDSPKVVGSLSEVQVVTGGREFAVGDTVNFTTSKGAEGQARVAAVTNRTGVVDFLFNEGGFGYTLNAESIVSEKVIALNNVVTSNTLDTLTVTSGGSGYANTDKIVVVSPTVNATAVLVTDDVGTIKEVTVLNPGSGFLVDSPTNILVTNATGGSTTGSSATFTANTKYQNSYFTYMELVVQPLANVVFESANAEFANGESIFTYHVNNAVAGAGKIISVSQDPGSANGELFISVVNGTFTNTSVIYTTGNTKTATANSATDRTATGKVMGIPSNAQFTVQSTILFQPNTAIYQSDATGEIANCVVTRGTVTGGGLQSLDVTDLRGVFTPNLPIRLRANTSTAVLLDTAMNVGVYDITDAYYPNNYVYTTTTSTNATLTSASFGFGAGFDVQNIGEIETIFLGTDLLASNNEEWLDGSLVAQANQEFMTLPIANYAYGFPKNPQGNSADIIYSCLNFEKFDIGVVGGLTSINPGAEYNVDPYVLIREPLIAAFSRNDYIIEIENPTRLFTPGERILQTSPNLQFYQLTLTDESGFVIGEKVYQGSVGTETATGVITDIFPANNIIKVNQVTGTFATSANVFSYISATTSNTTNVQLVEETAEAKGIVKSGNSTVLFVKRISFNNTFEAGGLISGQNSDAEATIKSIIEDESVRQIGLNANVTANVVTANGTATALQVIDSGFGYSNGAIVNFVSEDGSRTGDARLIVSGSGVGSGYYRSSKGFLSADKFLHDSDYYQEYSYEVLSKLPFDKYSEIFKKVMHTSGTRVFGSVILTEEANTKITVAESNTVQTLFERIQFNSNSSIVDGAIVFDNDYANNELVFANGDLVIYEALGGNTAVQPLSNGASYFVVSANTTSIKLATNSKVVQKTFNANTDVINNANLQIANNFIFLNYHNFNDNDVVRYITPAGNTAITGLTNNSVYFVVSANSTGVKLSSTRGGSPVTITAKSTSENGHTLSITTINITANSTHSGASTNGHFITLASEY